jgi:hypothetical protein
MTTARKIVKHQGHPPGSASMPTCGLCRRQINPGGRYVTIKEADSTGPSEVRHDTESCMQYVFGPASALVEGALIYTIRYTLTDWGGGVHGKIIERTEEFDEKHWRKYVIAPADPEDDSPLIEMRHHPEAFFRSMAKGMVWDPAPREVFIADAEWTHYVLPS